MAPRKRTTVKDARRDALLEARASIRADILLDNNMTPAQTLERVTKSFDRLLEKA